MTRKRIAIAMAFASIATAGGALAQSGEPQLRTGTPTLDSRAEYYKGHRGPNAYKSFRATTEMAAHIKQIGTTGWPLKGTATLDQLLQAKGLELGSEVMIQAFKRSDVSDLGHLEVFMKDQKTGRFVKLMDMPTCMISGDLGPKERQGDLQTPEGYYNLTEKSINDGSSYTWAINVNFPNTHDIVNGRTTGGLVMVHGQCQSVGCFAMGDKYIRMLEKILKAAFKGGQERVQMAIYPFRMTDANLEAHKSNRWYSFWKELKAGYDYFKANQVPPRISVRGKQYVVGDPVVAARAPRDVAVQPVIAAEITPPKAGDVIDLKGTPVVIANTQIVKTPDGSKREVPLFDIENDCEDGACLQSLDLDRDFVHTDAKGQVTIQQFEPGKGDNLGESALRFQRRTMFMDLTPGFKLK